MIHYDPWWNVAAQNQATDRAHRIGQEKQVSVFKLIMKDTVEENILLLQEQKRDLADQIISGEQVSIGQSQPGGITKDPFSAVKCQTICNGGGTEHMAKKKIV